MWKCLSLVLAVTVAQRPAAVQIRSGMAPVCEAVRQSLAGSRRTFAESLGKPPFAKAQPRGRNRFSADAISI